MTDTEPMLIAGRYRLVTALASGGMGVVWKGWDERLQRPVAIKQLRVQPGLSPSEAATARDRAMREARNTARLHHPHAVPVYDVVEHDGEPCLIMEFLPSISLHESIRQHGTLPAAEVARIGSELAKALSAAHGAGIVHRDVKPGNVLLADDGTTKLTDFGISHAIGDVALTATGMLTGTPAYLAPEVARGEPASFASDVFSLGSTLYSATEGVPPFGQDANAMAVLHRVASGQLRPPERSGSLTPLLERMLTADPQSRPTMTEVSDSLAVLRTGVGTDAALAAGAAAASRTTSRLAVPATPPARTDAAPPTLIDARPVGRPPRAQRGPRRGLIAALVISVLAIGAVAVAIALANRNGNSPSPRARATTTNPAPHSTSVTTPRSTSVTTARSTSAATPSAAADRLARAVTDYYALVPNSLQEGWTRLTPSYQDRTAGGFSGYQKFWSQFQRVILSDASGQPPDSAEATITYVYKDGRRAVERTRYQLVMTDGQWKINGSTVLSTGG